MTGDPQRSESDKRRTAYFKIPIGADHFRLLVFVGRDKKEFVRNEEHRMLKSTVSERPRKVQTSNFIR